MRYVSVYDVARDESSHRETTETDIPCVVEYDSRPSEPSMAQSMTFEDAKAHFKGIIDAGSNVSADTREHFGLG